MEPVAEYIIASAVKALAKHLNENPPDGVPRLICARHPIIRDELCSTCSEAKDRNEALKAVDAS